MKNHGSDGGFRLFHSRGQERSTFATDPQDPDFERDSVDIPPSHDALRTATFTYIEYVDGTVEHFDRTSDPDMLRNVAGTLGPERLTTLRSAVRGLATCVGADACGAAARAVS
ncbi:hypothetical protein [Actinoplanes philippinensis]|uniref:hypothetical protein n=1 Tax=Actinoplanes philippinensis TaxID=35752 RepID=UPI0033DC84F0